MTIYGKGKNGDSRKNIESSEMRFVENVQEAQMENQEKQAIQGASDIIAEWILFKLFLFVKEYG